MRRDGEGKSKSPRPPFFKGGNSNGFLLRRWLWLLSPPLQKEGWGGFAFPVRAGLTCLLLATLLIAGVGAAQVLPPALRSQQATMPPEQRALLLRRQTQLDAMTAPQRQAFVQRIAAWDALPPAEQVPRRDAWLAWVALPRTQRLRLRTMAAAYAALPIEQQLALREEFDALDGSERRGWLLGPVLGRDYPRLQPLLAQVPVSQRERLLAALRAMPPGERGDLAVLAQRTPPQERDALRRALLSTAAVDRAAWLRTQLDR
jgi:hypothetical protein